MLAPLSSARSIVQGQTKEQEDKIRTFFINNVTNQNKVDIEEFKAVMNKIADDFQTDFEGLAKQLADAAPQLLLDAVDGATSTLTSIVKEIAPKQ